MTNCEPLAMNEQLPITWDRAEGSTVWDDTGKSYIDFTSGIFVANVGHSHPKVVEALRKQLDHQLLHTYTFPSASRQRLARKLTQVTGFEKCFLLSTGSEAVEAALRVARGRELDKWFVVSWEGAMHGKTLGAHRLMGGCGPYSDGHVMPFPEHGERFVAPRHEWMAPSAAILESYHGWGALFYPKQYVQDVAQWCKDNGALLIFDEVQSGFGRTGKLFAYEHYDVEPDLVCCGKGLGGGLPISALLGSAELLDSDTSLTSTHSGNPLCCAAALATLQALEDEGLVGRANEIGLEFGKWIMKVDLEAAFLDVTLGCGLHFSVTGKGAVWAIWMNENPRHDPQAIDKANRIVELAATRGLLLLKTGCGTIKIGPPLSIPLEQLKEGLDILEGCLKEVM